MTELIGGLFVSVFGTHSALATFLISMLPLFELKGAIPVGMSQDFWGEYALSGTQSFFVSLMGSCLVVPILALIFIPTIKWLKNTKVFRKIGNALDNKVKKHSEEIETQTKGKGKNKTLLKWFIMFGFVSIPLPLTGVWTGACVAVAIGLNFWQVVSSCVLGNIVAGLIITVVCAVFPEFTTILFYIVIVIILALVVAGIVKAIINKNKSKAIEKTDNTETIDEK